MQQKAVSHHDCDVWQVLIELSLLKPARFDLIPSTAAGGQPPMTVDQMKERGLLVCRCHS